MIFNSEKNQYFDQYFEKVNYKGLRSTFIYFLKNLCG